MAGAAAVDPSDLCLFGDLESVIDLDAEVPHQVTYDTVLKMPRRALHRLVVEWMVTMTGERVGEHVGLIAHHFECAGDAAKAAAYLGRAGLAAYNAAAYGDALAAVDRALALLADSEEPRQRFALLLQRAEIHNATGRRAEQADDVEAAAQCAEQLDDDGLRVRAGAWRTLNALITGRYAEAIAESSRTEALAALQEGRCHVTLGAAAQALACFDAHDAASSWRA